MKKIIFERKIKVCSNLELFWPLVKEFYSLKK